MIFQSILVTFLLLAQVIPQQIFGVVPLVEETKSQLSQIVIEDPKRLSITPEQALHMGSSVSFGAYAISEPLYGPTTGHEAAPISGRFSVLQALLPKDGPPQAAWWQQLFNISHWWFLGALLLFSLVWQASVPEKAEVRRRIFRQ